MKMKDIICLGIAGNFINHLEQVGGVEAFKDVITKEENEPKAIFPFYVPNSDGFLGIYSIGEKKIKLPKYEINAQLEAEIAILFDILYDDNYKIKDLKAKKFTTFNDCMIRKKDSVDSTQKGSWESNSKGIADKWIDIDKFSDGGILDYYNICSFIKRDGILYSYGVNTPVAGYNFFNIKLKGWLIDKLNNQKKIGIIDDIYHHIKNANYPKEVLVSIGATAYTKFGVENFLKRGDEIYVVSYDSRYCKDGIDECDYKIILKQIVE